MDFGDGKAEVIDAMTEAEYSQYIHEQELGWEKFYQKLKNKIGL